MTMLDDLPPPFVPYPDPEPGLVPIVRMRATDADRSYPVGVTAFANFDPPVEDQGGITLAAGVFGVPEDGTYALTLLLNPTAAWGTLCTCGCTIFRRGATVFGATQPLQNTSVAAVASWSLELQAGDTVQYSWTNGSAAAVVMAIEAQIAKLA